MKLNVDEVLDGLNYLDKLTPKMIEKGLNAGVGEAFTLSDDVTPKIPFKDGHLKGEKETSKVDIKKTKIKKRFGYTQPYAARWHNTKEKINWTTAGSGPDYLGSKLKNYSENILDTMGEEMQKELEGSQ